MFYEVVNVGPNEELLARLRPSNVTYLCSLDVPQIVRCSLEDFSVRSVFSLGLPTLLCGRPEQKHSPLTLGTKPGFYRLDLKQNTVIVSTQVAHR